MLCDWFIKLAALSQPIGKRPFHSPGQSINSLHCLLNIAHHFHCNNFVLKFEQYSPSQYFLSPHHLSCTVRRNHYFVTLGSERDKFNYYSATCIFLSLSQLNCSYVEFYVLLGILCSYHLATSISIHFF